MQKQLLQTLVYADIFDYPLSLLELERFLIGRRGIGAKTAPKTLLEILSDIKHLPTGKAGVDTDGELYFLKGREKIVGLRKKREEWSKEKWRIARKAAEKLKWFPLIKLIGVTGALAMNNGKKEDDIDLLVITSRSALWLTRLAIFLLAPFLRIRRRKPGEQKIKNKICFNLFLEENHLRIVPENLFLAHEICQMKPILNRGRTYERFLWENRWAKDYLPNAVPNFKFQISDFKSSGPILNFFNYLAFQAQLLYMRPKMTVEKVSLHQAFFHPQNLQEKILARYEVKLKEIIK